MKTPNRSNNFLLHKASNFIRQNSKQFSGSLTKYKNNNIKALLVVFFHFFGNQTLHKWKGRRIGEVTCQTATCWPKRKNFCKYGYQLHREETVERRLGFWKQTTVVTRVPKGTNHQLHINSSRGRETWLELENRGWMWYGFLFYGGNSCFLSLWSITLALLYF